MKLKIVVPAAGLGSRFSMAGYDLPKPLIDAAGKPIIQRMIESIRPKRHEYQFIFIVQQEHCDKFAIDKRLKEMEPDCEIVRINGITEGSSCTVLAASHLIYNDPVLISVCDAIHLVDIDDFLDKAESKMGLMLTFEDDRPIWAYTEMDKRGIFVRLKEKEAISTHANSGLWYFGYGLLEAILEQIVRDDRTNNEFYVSMAYNHIPYAGIIDIYNGGFIPLGVPEELERFNNDTTNL